MQEIRILAFTVLITGVFGICTWNERPSTSFDVYHGGGFTGKFDSFEDDDDNDDDNLVKIYSANGDICLQAHLDMDLELDEDNFVESYEKKHHRFHVKTSNYTGFCNGENGFIFNKTITGPAIVFLWKSITGEDALILYWTVQDKETYLSKVIAHLTMPCEHGTGIKDLSAKSDDLHLFPSPIGSPVVISNDRLSLTFSKYDDGQLVFNEGDFTIGKGVVVGLSVLTIVCLVVALSMMMGVGAYFYHKGSVKKDNEALRISVLNL